MTSGLESDEDSDSKPATALERLGGEAVGQIKLIVEEVMGGSAISCELSGDSEVANQMSDTVSKLEEVTSTVLFDAKQKKAKKGKTSASVIPWSLPDLHQQLNTLLTAVDDIEIPENITKGELSKIKLLCNCTSQKNECPVTDKKLKTWKSEIISEVAREMTPAFEDTIKPLITELKTFKNQLEEIEKRVRAPVAPVHVPTPHIFSGHPASIPPVDGSL